VSSGEIILFAKRLREYGKAIEGDGFGKIGDLKAAIKRTCVRLEEVAELIDLCEAAAGKNPVIREEQRNPDCLGLGEHNLPGCDCRKVFDSINRKNHSSTI
jgi:hypothetical protein